MIQSYMVSNSLIWVTHTLTQIYNALSYKDYLSFASSGTESLRILLQINKLITYPDHVN